MAIYSWILEHSDIIGLIIDFIALVVSVILTVVIYKLERRHEKEHEAAEEKAQKAALAEAARVFLIDNDDEVDYLPLAAIAAKLKLKRKHCRNITTRFIRCSEKQQREILCQANIPDIQVSMDESWAALEKLQADLQRYEFGRSMHYICDCAPKLRRSYPILFDGPMRRTVRSSERLCCAYFRLTANAQKSSMPVCMTLSSKLKCALCSSAVQPFCSLRVPSQ